MKNSFSFKAMLFYVLVTMAVLSTSCGKKSGGNGNNNGANPDYYISFKVNGVQKRFTVGGLADLTFSSQSNLYSAVLGGSEGTTSSKGSIQIILFDNKAISEKTYQDPQKVTTGAGSKVQAVMIGYNDQAGNGYLSMGADVDENGHSLPGMQNVVADAKITLSKITSSLVEGTFSGTVQSATGNTNVSLTDGKFILRRIQ